MAETSPFTVVALQKELQAARERIAELEERVTRSEQLQHAEVALIIAALVHRLGGEVVLANDELARIGGELQSYETFGGRVFRLIQREGGAATDDVDV